MTGCRLCGSWAWGWRIVFRQEQSTSGVRWDNSVYYLWWEFLRRNEDYKKTCENGGKGKCDRLYADFGNVHEGTFKRLVDKG